MQSFGDLFANNRLLAIGVVLAAIAVILAVGIALFRLVFGRRLHMSGGRTRQPRLGVVDAFDLDRQRQLVLIRRDNVEHLLMIGGPNDVLVEAAIVRVPAAVNGRDKETGFTPSVGIPAPMPQQPTLPAVPVPTPTAIPANGPDVSPHLPVPAPLQPEPKAVVQSETPRPAPVIEPAPVAAAAPPPVAVTDARLPGASTLGPAAARPAAAPVRPMSPMPQRAPVAPVARPAAAPTPRANLSRATATTPPIGGAPAEARQPTRVEPTLPGRVEPTAARGPSEGLGNSDRPAQPAARDTSLPARFPPRPARTEEGIPAPLPSDADRSGDPQPTDRNGVEDTAQPVRSASQPARPLPTAPARSLPARPQGSAPAPALPHVPPRPSMPSLGSLEEEMAKLLGRPMPPPETPGSGT